MTRWGVGDSKLTESEGWPEEESFVALIGALLLKIMAIGWGSVWSPSVIRGEVSMEHDPQALDNHPLREQH